MSIIYGLPTLEISCTFHKYDMLELYEMGIYKHGSRLNIKEYNPVRVIRYPYYFVSIKKLEIIQEFRKFMDFGGLEKVKDHFTIIGQEYSEVKIRLCWHSFETYGRIIIYSKWDPISEQTRTYATYGIITRQSSITHMELEGVSVIPMVGEPGLENPLQKFREYPPKISTWYLIYYNENPDIVVVYKINTELLFTNGHSVTLDLAYLP